MTHQQNRRIEAAYNGIYDAQRVLEKTVKSVCRIGNRIRYTHGKSVVSGIVLRYSCGADRLFVKSDESGKEYWIHAYRVLE